MRLYLDAAPVIYLVEDIESYRFIVQSYLTRPGSELVATDLTRLECRLGPLRRANPELLRDFDEFFEFDVDEIVPLSRAVMDRATEIRAQYAFATPDAMHIAAALVSKCDVFLT